MELNVILVIIIAGGFFGMLLGKFLDSAPSWVFWLSGLVIIGALLYVVMNTSSA